MNSYTELAAVLTSRRAEVATLTAVAGFDGFVDEMIQVVGERTSLTHFTPMAAIPDFAAWASAAAGRSSLREIVVHRQDAGGCAVNCGDGLVGLGAQVELFATVGSPMHAAFAASLARFAAVHPLGDVFGRTLALEFGDGKLMLSAVAQLADIDAALAERVLCAGAFPAACARAQLIALTNWTLYPHMTGVWALLAERVFAKLTHRPAFLVDLVDPSGRSAQHILDMLKVLPAIDRCGHLALGVNVNEANVLGRHLGIAGGDEDARLGDLAERLRRALAIREVVIHGSRSAASAEATGTALVTLQRCDQPVKLTGAGDRFNAGYGLGLMLGLPQHLRLALGNVTSGCYVRSGISADIDGILALISEFSHSN